MDKTSIYDVKELRQELILLEINEVVKALEESHYNPTNQLVGYVLSGDDSYITSYKNARNKLKKYNRSEILMALFNNYIGKL